MALLWKPVGYWISFDGLVHIVEQYAMNLYFYVACSVNYREEHEIQQGLVPTCLLCVTQKPEEG